MQKFVGQDIDNRYRLTRYLDEGAFGAVFKAEQMAYGVTLREVAIKIAKQPMNNHEARTTFHDALIMTKVVDTIEDGGMRDHFITVHDAGRCSDDTSSLAGHPYMVMELVQGAGLHNHLSSGPFPLKRAISYFEQMLTAVSFMHTGIREDGRVRPVVHRDLKPANILVIRKTDGPDLIKLTDFGLAIEVETLLGWTQSGGTMDYLAPESFSHNVCSPQSDVYALGLIFYEMVTGRQPFAGIGHHLGSENQPGSEEVRRLHLAARQKERFSLLDSHEELRNVAGIVEVIRSALAPDMATRKYRNALELKTDWDRAGRGRRPPRPSISPWQRVGQLLEQAEQCYGVGEQSGGDKLLIEAMEINRNAKQVPDSMLSSRCYLLEVRRLIRLNNHDEAGKVANEGYQRKKSYSTCCAMADYYAAINSPAAEPFRTQADECKDRG